MYCALSYKIKGGLTRRHDLVKEDLADLCRAGNVECTVEPPQAFSGSKLRPDLLVIQARHGHDVAFDLTIHSPLRDDYSMSRTIRNEQSFLESAASTKINKYRTLCANNGDEFMPIVFSAFGGIWRDSYDNGLMPLINKIKKERFIPPNWAAPDKVSYWLQRIVISLWAGNARKLRAFMKKDPLPTF